MITGTKGDAVTGQWSTHGIELLADRCCGCLTAVVQRFGGVVRWSE